MNDQTTNRRRPLLLNVGEQATDVALAEAAERAGVRVFPKVRLASALKIDGSGITDQQFSYALKAEFDFVVADGKDGLPQFAVEFDEPHHLNDNKTIARDQLKAQICRRFDFPLIRVGSEYLRRERRFTLIGWLVEVWALERSFYEAQDRGEIPWDEPFMPENIVADSPTSKFDFPYWLDAPARGRMFRAQQAGHAPQHVPETLSPPYADRDGDFIESYCVFELDGNYVIGNARLRNFGGFAGVSACQLAESVAVADAGENLRQILGGERQPSSSADLADLRSRTKGWISQGVLIGDVPYSLKKDRGDDMPTATHDRVR